MLRRYSLSPEHLKIPWPRVSYKPLFLRKPKTMNHFFTEVSFSIIWMTTSIGIAELARDIWHTICHLNPWLYKHFHRWHHIAYGRNFAKNSEALWRKAEWRHGIPETLIMLICSTLYWFLVHQLSNEWYVQGTLAGILFSARLMLFVILRGLGLFTKVDDHHLPHQFDTPPSIGKINIAYHYKHHFVDVNAYFGAIYTFIDQILGTALSFHRATVALSGLSSEWTNAISSTLIQNGASVAKQFQNKVKLDKVDILVLGNGDESLIKPFFNTVQSNRDIACKELWWICFPQTPALPDWVRNDAPCTVRVIDIFSETGLPNPESMKSLLFQAKRHNQHILLTDDLSLAIIYRLRIWVNLLWYANTKRFSLNNPK